jgi:hypothetical protein
MWLADRSIAQRVDLADGKARLTSHRLLRSGLCPTCQIA